MTCKAIDNKKQVVDYGHQEGVKYPYVDIFDPNRPEGNNTMDVLMIKPQRPFNYAAENRVSGFKVQKNEILGFSFDFRDWKYLSGYTRFQSVIDDAEVIAGLKEGSLEIDFSKL